MVIRVCFASFGKDILMFFSKRENTTARKKDFNSVEECQLILKQMLVIIVVLCKHYLMRIKIQTLGLKYSNNQFGS